MEEFAVCEPIFAVYFKCVFTAKTLSEKYSMQAKAKFQVEEKAHGDINRTSDEPDCNGLMQCSEKWWLNEVQGSEMLPINVIKIHPCTR